MHRYRSYSAEVCEVCGERAIYPTSEPTKCQKCWTASVCIVCGPMRAAWGGRPLKDGVCEMCKPRMEDKKHISTCIQCQKPSTIRYPSLFPLECYSCFCGESTIFEYSDIRCARCAGFVKQVKNKDLHTTPISYCSKCTEEK